MWLFGQCESGYREPELATVEVRWELHSTRTKRATEKSMPYDTTQPSLLLRIRDSSNSTAWNEFEAKYRELISRYCRRRGLQPADCDDVQQIVWLHLSKGLREFEYDPKRGRFRGYLGQVVRSAIARHFSRPDPADRALDTTMLAITPDCDATSPDEQWEEEWVDHHYRLAMATVRRTFESSSVQIFERLLAGDAVATVAETFTTSLQAVHKVKQRIRRRLQELIARQIDEEDDPDRAPGLAAVD